MVINNLYKVKYTQTNQNHEKWVSAPSIQEIITWFSSEVQTHEKIITSIILISEELLDVNLNK